MQKNNTPRHRHHCKKTPAQLHFRTITAAPPVTEAVHWRSMSYGRVCLSQLGDIETADSID